MKYLGEETEVQVKTVSKRNIEYIRCDECYKKIIPHSYGVKQSQYVHIHTWHNDWGAESIESHQYNDYCLECAKKVVAEYISDMSGTEELELENKYLIPNESKQGYEGWCAGYALVENDRQTLLEKEKENEEKAKAVKHLIDLFPNARAAILDLDLEASEFGAKDSK